MHYNQANHFLTYELNKFDLKTEILAQFDLGNQNLEEKPEILTHFEMKTEMLTKKQNFDL